MPAVSSSAFGPSVIRRYLPCLAALAMLAMGFAPPASRAGAKSPPDITGDWMVYPSRGKGGPPDPKLVAPQPTPLLLTPKYAGPYEAKRAAERESDKRGEPLANDSTRCIPNGMPQMMFPIYPIEILQTRALSHTAQHRLELARPLLDRSRSLNDGTPP